VKAYVKRNKNDAADAEAICEAVRRPTMRFVQIKSAEQQGQQHRTRDLLMRQRTQLINALRAHLAELGIVAAQGREGIQELLAIVADHKDQRIPIDARASLMLLAAQLQAVQTVIGLIEKRIMAQHRSNEASKRLETIPGIGVIGATAIAATVADPSVFRSGRDFAAWIGLVLDCCPQCRVHWNKQRGSGLLLPNRDQVAADVLEAHTHDIGAALAGV
jgi:transposase